MLVLKSFDTSRACIETFWRVSRDLFDSFSENFLRFLGVSLWKLLRIEKTALRHFRDFSDVFYNLSKLVTKHCGIPLNTVWSLLKNFLESKKKLLETSLKTSRSPFGNFWEPSLRIFGVSLKLPGVKLEPSWIYFHNHQTKSLITLGVLHQNLFKSFLVSL